MSDKKKFTDALDNILDRPIAFNPSFKKITKSTNAALLLSQAFYWTKRTSDPNGWFYKTRLEWMDETGLTEDELDGAREKCRQAGVMEEKLKGVPATIYYRVNKAKVYELLGFQIPTFPESGLSGNSQIPENQESGNPADFNKESESTTGITLNVNERVKLLIKLHNNNISMVVPVLLPKLQAAAAEFTDHTWYEPAFAIAAGRKALNWNFVYTVLRNWKDNGRDWTPVKEKPGKKAASQSSTPSVEYDYDALRKAALEAKKEREAA